MMSDRERKWNKIAKDSKAIEKVAQKLLNLLEKRQTIDGAAELSADDLENVEQWAKQFAGFAAFARGGSTKILPGPYILGQPGWYSPRYVLESGGELYLRADGKWTAKYGDDLATFLTATDAWVAMSKASEPELEAAQ